MSKNKEKNKRHEIKKLKMKIIKKKKKNDSKTWIKKTKANTRALSFKASRIISKAKSQVIFVPLSYIPHRFHKDLLLKYLCQNHAHLLCGLIVFQLRGNLDE